MSENKFVNLRVQVSEEKLLAQMMKHQERLPQVMEMLAGFVNGRNRQYGDSWQEFGMLIPLIRIREKILRAQTISGLDITVMPTEGIYEACKDIIGYCGLMMIWMEENQVATLKVDLEPKKTKEEIEKEAEEWRQMSIEDKIKLLRDSITDENVEDQPETFDADVPR